MARMTPGLGKPIDLKPRVSSLSTFPAPDLDLSKPVLDVASAPIVVPAPAAVVTEPPSAQRQRVRFIFLQAGNASFMPAKEFDVVPTGTVPLAASAHALAHEVTKGRTAFREAAAVMGVQVVGLDGREIITGTKDEMGAAYAEHRGKFARPKTDNPNDPANRTIRNVENLFGLNK